MVDFDKEMVLVAAGSGPNIITLTGPSLCDTGDLTFGWSVTERAEDGSWGSS